MESPLNASLKKLNIIYFLLGLSYDIAHTPRKIIVIKRFIYVSNFFWLNSDVSGSIWWFIDGVRNGKSFIELTYIAPCLLFSFFANVRAYTLVHYEKEVSELIELLRKLEERENARKRTRERDEIIAKDLKFLHTIINASNVLNFVLVITFFISPLILTVVIFLKTDEWDLQTPFLILYPFDAKDIRYWPFVYFHQFVSETIVVFGICGTDYLLYICCMFIRIQFRLLQFDFTNIIKPPIPTEWTHSCETFKQEFIELVEWHQQAIRASEILEAIFSKATLFNFVSSSILLCLTGFNVTALEDMTLACTFLVFLSANLLQIFFVCFFGDMHMRSSSDVSYAIYNNKWHLASSRVGKNLHIIQTRAQKPCKLTAFGFADVNHRAFMSILSSAWSYFALLNTVYNPGKD